MSKMDDLRAMREARYAQRVMRPAGAVVSAPVAPPAVSPSRVATAQREPAAAAPSVEAGLCGHRAISGRTCTREQGHTAKSHRYA